MSTIEQIDRFSFGENWSRFLRVLDDDRIAEATESLRRFLNVEDLRGRRFLDIGSGSGLFSLAARRLGAEVVSFDFDEDSVACTEQLRARYFPEDPEWRILEGSVLDRAFIHSLGTFDVVYAWGVLHHTNALWTALHNAQTAVAPVGRLYVAIYNDQGLVSSAWLVVKRLYVSSRLGRWLLTPLFFSLFFAAGLILDLVRLRDPRRRYREHRKQRGMSLLHDWRDWLGGYPYQVARPDRVRAYLENLGFALRHHEAPPIGFGNNRFLFERATAESGNAPEAGEQHTSDETIDHGGAQ